MIFGFKIDSGVTNAKELVAKQQTVGGKIVAYPRIYSAGLVSYTTHAYLWVPDENEARREGRKQALWCMLTGWWSLTGIFRTPCAICINWAGGDDVTRMLIGPPLLPGEADPLAAKSKKRQLIFLCGLVVVLLLVVAKGIMTMRSL